MSKIIFRRWEIRTRGLRTGVDMAIIIQRRFFTRWAAERECRHNNAYRFIQGAKGFEHYVKDRREDV